MMSPVTSGKGSGSLDRSGGLKEGACGTSTAVVCVCVIVRMDHQRVQCVRTVACTVAPRITQWVSPGIGGDNPFCQVECLALPCCGQQVVGPQREGNRLLAVSALQCSPGMGGEGLRLGLQ